MTTPPLSAEQVAAIRAHLGDAKPATSGLLADLAQSITDRKAHDHPKHNEDFFCENLSGWAGDRMPVVLRRLIDAEAEADRLRAENEAMRAVQRVHVAGFEAVLLIADRDPDAATSSSAWHEAIGYNNALSDVRAAIVPAAAPTATT
jgi:hypothetical protein